ncbi:hypothetical protein C0J52_09320, partial [Blattella germanica]
GVLLITEAELQDIIDKLKQGKLAGPDYTKCSIIVNGTSCFSANPSKAVLDACTYPKPTKTVDFGLKT